MTMSAILYNPINNKIDIANFPYLFVKFVIGLIYMWFVSFIEMNLDNIKIQTITPDRIKHNKILKVANKNLFKISSLLNGLLMNEYKNKNPNIAKIKTIKNLK